MAQFLNNAEGGSNTTTVTTGNSGGASGTAFSTVTASATCTLTFDNAHVAHGSLAYKHVLGATAGECYGDISPGTVTSMFCRAYAYFTANPAGNINLIRAMNATTQAARAQVNTAGKIVVANSAGTAIATSTNSIPLNAWFRVETQFVFSATVGQTNAWLYTGDSVTATEALTPAATQNTGTQATLVRFGHSSTGVANTTFWTDDLGIDTVAALGPVALGQVVNLVATPITSTRVDLTWDAVSGASGYEVERGGVIIAYGVGTNAYSDTGLTPSTTYTYRVRAIRD